MMRVWVLGGVVTFALMHATLSHAQNVAEAQAQSLFAQRHLSGALVMQDIRNGQVVATSEVGDGANGLPLSAVKLLLVASYFHHRAELPAELEPNIDAIIARGLDDPGRELALELRRALGEQILLDDLRRFGFPRCVGASSNCTTLSRTTPDLEWTDAMSLGEIHFRATPLAMSHFLVAVANNGRDHRGRRIMSAAAAAHLREAMLRTVEFGTARGVRALLPPDVGLGGKTGTGPAGPQPYDGMFAGLVFDGQQQPRFTIVTYVRRGGYGGGAAAEISAAMASALMQHEATLTE